MDGEIGEKMKTHISLEGSPHFVLDDEERCPFLNRNGLCDLILSCGKDVLCDICREHPRYYNEFEDHTEAGLGLCCEAAARLVIGWDDKEGFPYPTPDFSEDNCLKKRNELLLAVKNATCARTLQKRLLKTIAQEKLPFESLDFAKFLLTLERLDDHWTKLLER
jgi:lysine-N-methylase